MVSNSLARYYQKKKKTMSNFFSIDPSNRKTFLKMKTKGWWSTEKL